MSTAEAPSKPSEAISISRMTEHDLLEVVEIEEYSGLSRWGWGAYYAELQGGNRPLMLVARITRPQHHQAFRIAGYIVARLATDELHINNVAVRFEYRRQGRVHRKQDHRQGIGAALLTRVLEEGRRFKATTAFLEVRAGNSLAQALYKKCGFTSIGRRSGYYSTPPEDALVMSATL